MNNNKPDEKNGAASRGASGEEFREEAGDIFEAIERLAAGDLDFRLKTDGTDSFHDKLRLHLNRAAEEFSEVVNMTHEFAMGLAENFDVLQRVSAGDLSARINGSSNQEIVECLKDLTNSMIDKLSEEITLHRETQAELNRNYLRLQEANRQIMDGVEYAWRIQSSVLPSNDEASGMMREFFIFHKPKDVLGGDIYWLRKLPDESFIAAIIDCTGHGVPGAFMTMIAATCMDRVVAEKGIYEPEEILFSLNSMVKHRLNQHLPGANTDDGFDICVVRIIPSEKLAVFAGAHTDLYLCDGERVTRIKGDRQSIGYRSSDITHRFTRHEVPIQKGTRIYTHTDGLTDQIGHKTGLPFGRNRFTRFLLDTHHLSLKEQRLALKKVFEEYVGNEDQRDDVTVGGFCIWP